MNNQEFIDYLSSKSYPVLKSLAIAQACLESQYGKKSFYNNIYGIKCHNPNLYAGCRLGKTKEFIDGSYKDYKLAFQTYNSIEENIEDYSRLMNLPRYRSVRESKNYIEATEQVKKCGYATSITYVQSLRKIIEKYKLYELDYKMNPKEYLTKNFRYYEFFSGDIKLGLKSIEPPKRLFDNILIMANELQKVRDYIQSPIIITSAYRTSNWNRYCGGVNNSYHVQGKAVDIKVVGMPLQDLAIYMARLTEFNGYGINLYKGFIHCDMRKNLMVFKY